MSAFLGPIHYWLYNKINIQQDITDRLYPLGDSYGRDLRAECDSRYGEYINQPLDKMIDLGNIHGWLQERVSQVEYKYAYTVTTLLEIAPQLREQLLQLLWEAGNNQAKIVRKAEEQPSPSHIYTLLSDQLLDGMPCDRANQLVSQNSTEAVWIRKLCVHSPYWEELGGNIADYYELREAWMRGFLREFYYSFEKTDAVTYRIYAA
ncbi:hypothetical protein HNQ56_003522 [Anaerotaenia torta]|uniref:hypothetical protein n=1 Tax=Anaerotaenia torta TaxID=433293 RepID=UPI003D19BBEB